MIAALAIIGGSVTAMLVAQANAMARLKSSALQLTAQHAAKELIAGWRIDKENVSVPAEGEAPGPAGWTWTRSARQVAIAEGVSATEVTLQIVHDSSDRRAAPWSREFRWLVRDVEP